METALGGGAVNRRVTATLVATFLGLVAATVWVPVEPPPDSGWAVAVAPTYVAIWQVGDGLRVELPFDLGYEGLGEERVPVQIRWARLGLTLGCVAALGGLLAFALRLYSMRERVEGAAVADAG